ncbi:Polyisoprenoid-binding protein YceI [Marinospirillum celere]|uniref:Polyisoprenoid-binding protein YceI n=1 Tax=Marinospirillum celere TaxID=1122252 RepID=A0A1I1HYQ4_9GAMM|nr:YceI family protein [Marinospirillum celere]SFC28915.1 Polyisoprenoid-binding protein YceI [Marinospirillum celere]
MQFKSSLKGLALATAFAASPVMAADYVIDTQGAHASINFKIDHLGFSYVVGRFNDFEGSFTWDSEQPENSTAEVTIRTNSIDSNHAERDRHIRSDDFLDVRRFSEANFTSTGFEYQGDGKGLLTGDLTLMGETRSIGIEVEHYGEGEDPWGEYRAGFTGTTELHLPDFGIKFNLGPAAETVYMDLHVEGVRQR